MPIMPAFTSEILFSPGKGVVLGIQLNDDDFSFKMNVRELCAPRKIKVSVSFMNYILPLGHSAESPLQNELGDSSVITK